MAADRAIAETKRSWTRNKQLETELRKQKKEADEIRNELAIMRREFQMLKKRPAEELQDDDEALKEAVVQQIKKRRKQSVSQDEPVTLHEKRTLDRSNIEAHLKANKNLLTPWTSILDACVDGKESKMLLPLKSVGDFIDGFEVVAPDGFNAQQLCRFFKDHGIDVQLPKVRKKRSHYWV